MSGVARNRGAPSVVGRSLAMAVGVVTSLGLVLVADGEIFSATAHVDVLLRTEQAVVDIVDRYIADGRRRLADLERITKDYKRHNNEESETGSAFEHVIVNPIQAFLLIRRLISDWTDAERLMRHNAAEEFLRNITATRDESPVKFPENADFEGAAAALMRLQDVYQLDTHDVAEGRIRNVPAGQKMNALDCYLVGQVAYQKQDYYHTLMWMQEALDRLFSEPSPTVDEASVVEYLAFAQFQQGNVLRALRNTRRLLQLRPDYATAKRNVKFYEDRLKTTSRAGNKELSFADDALPPLENVRPDDAFVPQRDIYEHLCRTEGSSPSPAVAKRLFCYLKQDRPFLRLAPIKVEVVFPQPRIVFFHQILSDDEIAVLKRLALPLLRRATVHNSDTGVLETAHYRVSKHAWLDDSAHPVVARITRRTEDMTGLRMNTSEFLQIANYGIGGHYEPHFDMSTLSQPIAGGGTVFPTLKTGISAKKNDALFWHNLVRSGEPDESTLHAACPVLAGSKWVANRWIRERGQEFNRPCAVIRDAD